MYDLSRGLMRRPPDVAVAWIGVALQQLRQPSRELITQTPRDLRRASGVVERMAAGDRKSLRQNRSILRKLRERRRWQPKPQQLN